MENSGVKKFFANNWEKMALWGIMIGLFYLLRPFFLLIFETFLIAYIAKSCVQAIVARTQLGHKLATVMVFVVFTGILFGAGWFVGPKLIVESNQILADFAGDGEQQTKERIGRFVERSVMKVIGEEKGQSFIDSQGYARIVELITNESGNAVKAALPRVLQGFLHIIKLIWEILMSLVLSVIFSFIIVLDWERISSRMRELGQSRIKTFYNGCAPHAVAFAHVLGKAFRAQAMIAACNTILTAAGLCFFHVPNIALLSVIVFFCGFIPILGLFISSVPILLFGAQVGGLTLIFKLMLFIAAVHAVEAYILNPKITADVLHVHPILILVLLLIGERFFGIWGMVVGVPVGYYLISVLTKKDDSVSETQDETGQKSPASAPRPGKS